MRLLASSLAPVQQRLILLSPKFAEGTDAFHDVRSDPGHHKCLTAEMQRFRGAIYLQDGAIKPWDLAADGRHELKMDADSWHLLALNDSGKVCGCLRYCPHGPTERFDNLWLKNAALASSVEWGWKLRTAVEREMASARERGVPYVEVGGWAIAPERRGTIEALRLALATYGLAQLLGGSLGITTATVRHSSAMILRRIGGRRFQWDGAELPPYYDPQYECEMEMLRFDSLAPGTNYRAWVDELRTELQKVPVVCGTPPRALWQPEMPVRDLIVERAPEMAWAATASVS